MSSFSIFVLYLPKERKVKVRGVQNSTTWKECLRGKLLKPAKFIQHEKNTLGNYSIKYSWEKSFLVIVQAFKQIPS